MDPDAYKSTEKIFPLFFHGSHVSWNSPEPEHFIGTMGNS